MTEFECGEQRFDAYVANAAGGCGPGVIVLQEWWGLVGHIKDVADRFAQEGFTAMAPDLYDGDSTREPDEAGSLMMALNIGKTETILRCAADRLLDLPSVAGSQVGVIGFCMGGQLSLFAATLNPKIGACVDFYGIHPNVNPDLSQLRAPVLGVFAEHDDYASPASVAMLSGELARLGKPHEFHTYPGTHHAFFNDQRAEVYDAAASEDAWSRTLDFFRAHLG